MLFIRLTCVCVTEWHMCRVDLGESFKIVPTCISSTNVARIQISNDWKSNYFVAYKGPNQYQSLNCHNFDSKHSNFTKIPTIWHIFNLGGFHWSTQDRDYSDIWICRVVILTAGWLAIWTFLQIMEFFKFNYGPAFN